MMIRLHRTDDFSWESIQTLIYIDSVIYYSKQLKIVWDTKNKRILIIDSESPFDKSRAHIWER